jgi:hypothetical protein
VKPYGSVSSQLANGCACDAIDVGTCNAEVVEFAVRHAAEFDDGLTVHAPICKRTGDVHDVILSIDVCKRRGLALDFLRIVICCIAQIENSKSFNAPMLSVHGYSASDYKLLTNYEVCRFSRFRRATNRGSLPSFVA